ncbi:hypothetical protein MSKOL_3418 [Methanosarcina sp. Kolksee]|uniref:hypothetical protein n=1 Tax=Methanosarcina sp. Kolksee TaxID=1434099 RepID=UPI0006159457|nr:hypothetical protein [Methanosarcina sp. Kolksee]AKB49195.1 hypothetical protein MSKOL_3418 [Methanosarcina sp. Kolksee]
MKTIEEVLDEFLFEQWARLSSKTYSGYEDAIYYFEEYLNGWAHKYLSEIDQIRLNEFYEEEGKRYCAVFGPEYISSLEIKDFLGHFMIRNVLTSKTFLETMGKVMHKLVKWMHEKAYMSHDNYEALNLLVKRLKVDMPVAEEVSDLLCLYALSHSVKNYSETRDDFFIITEIKTGKLWFESYSDGKNIGPVLVSEKISSMCKVGWTICLLLAKTGNNWRVLESGNMYP